MIFTLPQSGFEFLVFIVPLLTVLLGVAFLLMPRRMLSYTRLQADAGKPYAVGTARSSIAGVLVAAGTGCLLLQEPMAQQPGLTFILALGWLMCGFGYTLQVIFNGTRSLKIIVHTVLAFVLGAIAWYVKDETVFLCSPTQLLVSGELCNLPESTKDWFLFVLAGLTAGLGLIAFLMPRVALNISGLQSMTGTLHAVGESRNLLASFYLSIGGTYLFSPQPIDFVALVLSGAWLFAGAGRFISIVFDRGWGLYNIMRMVFEVAAGSFAIALIFGII